MKRLQKIKTSKVSWIVFICSFVIVLVNIISVMFPSLIISTLIDKSGFEAEPFEQGSMFTLILISNFSILALGILYYKGKLPHKIKHSIEFLRNFEVSHSVALLVLVVLIFAYIGWAMGDLAVNEERQFGDYKRVTDAVENWPLNEEGKASKSLVMLHVKNFFLKSSEILFQNMKVVPFLASISLLFVTYLFTVKITGKRFSGLCAVAVVIQSSTFVQFSTIATYANFWVLFYLVSLYMIIQKWPLSPISYIASIFSKPLSAIFLPMTLFFTYRAEIPTRKKVYITISYLVIFAAAAAGMLLLDVDIGGGIGPAGTLTFDVVDFLAGFTVWSFQLRADIFLLMFILPLTVGLFLVARKDIPYADSILVIIVGITLTMPLLAAMTDFRLHPYRYVPLIVFFGIGVGMLFSNKISQARGLNTV